MKIVLLIWGSLVGLFGFMAFLTGTTVMQEIAGANLLIAGTVAVSAFATINAIEAAKKATGDEEVADRNEPKYELG